MEKQVIREDLIFKTSNRKGDMTYEFQKLTTERSFERDTANDVTALDMAHHLKIG